MKKRITDFSIPVHKGLQSPDQFLGIGMMAFFSVFVITFFLVYLFSLWFILFGVGLLIALHITCKKDPFLVDIIFDSLSHKDIYLG